MDDRGRLLDRLRDDGVPDDEVDRAEQEGRLASLAVEVALGGQGRHSLTAVSREAGLSAPRLRALLQAVGRPLPARGSRAFTDEDVELARLTRELLDAGLPYEEIVEVARVVGRGMAQVAEALRRLVGDALIEPGDSEHSLGVRYTQAVDDLGPLVPQLVTLTLRAHLREGIRTELITEAEREAGQLADTREVAVGFADLVGYTELGADIEPTELGAVVGRFGDLAARSVGEPVRLVKMVGDAAMFVSPDTGAIVSTLAKLRDEVGKADPPLPQLRIGLAFGPATPRVGDWFGTTVNVASRVASAAKPGQLLATEEVLEQTGEKGWKRRRRRSLKGIEGWRKLYSYEGA